VSRDLRPVKAQYNYHPERTRPDGPGGVRKPDDRRPREWGSRPGKPVSGPSTRKPYRV
jgi:hypothetical protein